MLQSKEESDWRRAGNLWDNGVDYLEGGFWDRIGKMVKARREGEPVEQWSVGTRKKSKN